MKAELKRKNVGYRELAERLVAMGVHDSERNTANKISRGVHCRVPIAMPESDRNAGATPSVGQKSDDRNGEQKTAQGNNASCNDKAGNVALPIKQYAGPNETAVTDSQTQAAQADQYQIRDLIAQEIMADAAIWMAVEHGAPIPLFEKMREVERADLAPGAEIRFKTLITHNRSEIYAIETDKSAFVLNIRLSYEDQFGGEDTLVSAYRASGEDYKQGKIRNFLRPVS